MTCINWECSPTHWRLSRESVHVWAISVRERLSELARLFSYLSEQEVERAGRFHFEKDRVQFIIARGLLRKILGHVLCKDPRAIDFSYGKNGKPNVTHHPEVQFSLSHAGDLVLYTVALDREVGIDVEPIHAMPDLDCVARRFFFSEELIHLKRFTGQEKEQEFFRLWTRGEALLKWCGEGMTEPDHRRKIAETFRGEIIELNPANGYLASLVVSGKDFKLFTWHWPFDVSALEPECEKSARKVQ